MKRWLTLFLAVLMVLSTVSMTVLAEEPEKIEENAPFEEQESAVWEESVEPAMAFTVMSGFCGGDETADYDNYDKAYKNLWWTLDSMGVLTIGGEGTMMDFDKQAAPWSYYKTSLKKLVIEEGVTSIGKSAFNGYSGLSGDLVIPNSVKTIGDNAFRLCSGFNGKLTIGNGVISIGDGAFSSCSGFTGYLILPYGVIAIGDSAFEFCSGFSDKLILPETVQSIGAKAFSICLKITDVYYIGNAPTVPNAENANAAFDSTVIFHYPEGASGWSANWNGYKAEVLDGGIIDHGSRGANVFWMLESNGVLTVYGVGVLEGETAKEKWGAGTPWYPYWDFITGICVTDGIENYSQTIDQQTFQFFSGKGLRITPDDKLTVSFAKVSDKQKTLDFSHTYFSESSVGYAFSCTEVLAQDVEISWDLSMTVDDLKEKVYPDSSDSKLDYFVWEDGNLYFCFTVDYSTMSGQPVPSIPVLVSAGSTLGKLEINSVEPEEDDVIMSGFCGGDTKAEYDKASEAYKNLKWELTYGGTLTVSGEGAMMDYDLLCSPFSSFAQIRLVIKEGVTSIGDHAFYQCGSFTGDPVLPKSITRIGAGAFLGTAFEKVYCKGNAPAVEKANANDPSFGSGVTFCYLEGNNGWITPTWNGYTTCKWEISKAGDINNDGTINVIDANIVRRTAAKMVTLDATQELAADVNGDGSVDALDANMIRKYAAGLVTKFPAQVG